MSSEDTDIVLQYKAESSLIFFFSATEKKWRTCLGTLSSSTRIPVVLTFRNSFPQQGFNLAVFSAFRFTSTALSEPSQYSEAPSPKDCSVLIPTALSHAVCLASRMSDVWLVMRGSESAGLWFYCKLAIPLTLENSHRCALC